MCNWGSTFTEKGRGGGRHRPDHVLCGCTDSERPSPKLSGLGVVTGRGKGSEGGSSPSPPMHEGLCPWVCESEPVCRSPVPVSLPSRRPPPLQGPAVPLLVVAPAGAARSEGGSGSRPLRRHRPRSRAPTETSEQIRFCCHCPPRVRASRKQGPHLHLQRPCTKRQPAPTFSLSRDPSPPMPTAAGPRGLLVAGWGLGRVLQLRQE